jgi:ribosomal-protein-alanine acetyltransferase
MPKRYTVRRLRASLLDRIVQIERASFGNDAWDRNLFAKYGRTCGDLFLVAGEGKNICGYMITCVRKRGELQTAELASVAVDPAARGQGVASALMEATLRRLRRRGVARLSLMVKVTNGPAYAFYERYQFHKVRRVRGYYEDAADGWLMSRILPAGFRNARDSGRRPKSHEPR